MSCNNLIVSTSSSDITIIASGEKHGHVETATPTSIVYGNTGSYGPDAQLTVYKGGKQVSVLHVQQNYCFMQAGNIAANTVAGADVSCNVTEGSYSSGKGGKILIESA